MDADVLNPQSGHNEPRTIVSALFPRSTFGAWDFENIDPV